MMTAAHTPDPADAPKHTPGPWHFNPESGNVHGGKPDDGLCTVVALVGMGREMDANAHLIAAAPELLAACDRALNFLNNAVEFGFIKRDTAHDALQELREAISKAEGGQS